jgi:hypothetical protein
MGFSGENRRLLPKVILWGAFGGLCSGAVHGVLQWIWEHVLQNTGCLSPALYYTQEVLLLALVFALFGYCAGEVFSTGKKFGELIVGLVSGTCTALVLIAIIAFLETVWNAGDFSSLPLMFAEIFVASVVIQVLAAYFHKPRSGSAPDKMVIQTISALTGQLYSCRFFICVILAVLLVPPALLYLVDSPTPPDQFSSCYGVNDYAEASRTAPDSLRIVMQPDSWAKHNTPPTLKIFVDDRDVSNQSLISEAGLDAVIDPPDGLLFTRRASVTLQGTAVSGNGTVPVHLVIIATYPDTGRRVVIGERNL